MRLTELLPLQSGPSYSALYTHAGAPGAEASAAAAGGSGGGDGAPLCASPPAPPPSGGDGPALLSQAAEGCSLPPQQASKGLVR